MLDIHQIRTESNMEDAIGKVDQEYKIRQIIVVLNEAINKLYALIPFNTELPKEIREIKVSDEYIIDGVCDFYGIDRNYLRTYHRNKNLVERRRMAIRLLHLYTDCNLNQIAKLVGLRNHATVLHHIKQADLLLSKEFYGNDEIKRTYKQLLNHLKL